MGIVAGSELAASGMAFHIVGYALSTLAAFLGITIYFNLTGKEQIADYAGLANRSPFLAMALMAAFFSSAGLPFFIGFATKFYLFAAVAEQGFLWLVSLAILNSIISLYYYLQVVRQMYVEKGEDASPLRMPGGATALLAALTVALVVLGIYPGWVVQGAEMAVTALF
jgi:NADH-quinone oxidoreductase subunit N